MHTRLRKRLPSLCAAMAVLAIAACVCGQQAGDYFVSSTLPGHAAAWNRKPNPPSGSNFSFTVFSDRTGGAYPGGMERAVETVNRNLHSAVPRSEFVISIGDNIEGMTDDANETRSEWEQFDAVIGRMAIPFIRAPGNHDLGNKVMEQVYQERYGRPYGYFVYDNVLFLSLDTEDPPTFSAGTHAQVSSRNALISNMVQAAQKHPSELLRLQTPTGSLSMCDSDPDGMSRTNPISDKLAYIGKEQVRYFQRVLQRYKNVRWTFVSMHRPGWRPRSEGFAEIVAAMKDRRYTVIAGHLHEYRHETIEGHDYFMLGPTAAIPRCSGPVGANQIMIVDFVDGLPKFRLEPIDETVPVGD